MAFFQSAVGTLQTLVVALGAGLGIWGAINLMEGWHEGLFLGYWHILASAVIGVCDDCYKSSVRSACNCRRICSYQFCSFICNHVGGNVIRGFKRFFEK